MWFKIRKLFITHQGFNDVRDETDQEYYRSLYDKSIKLGLMLGFSFKRQNKFEFNEDLI